MDDAFFAARHTAFLVGKQAVEIYRMPTRGEKVTLDTACEPCKKGSMKRITHLRDEAGRELAMVDCRWIVMDPETERILRQPSWCTPNYENDTLEEELPQLVHNSCYLDIACDALPLEVLRKGPLRLASIKYHREIPMGAEVAVSYAPSADGWYVVGRREEHMAFECYLEFADEGAQKV